MGIVKENEQIDDYLYLQLSIPYVSPQLPACDLAAFWKNNSEQGIYIFLVSSNIFIFLLSVSL